MTSFAFWAGGDHSYCVAVAGGTEFVGVVAFFFFFELFSWILCIIPGQRILSDDIVVSARE